ncbi:hypothetical protein D3C78_1339990 [compost metagenome]
MTSGVTSTPLMVMPPVGSSPSRPALNCRLWSTSRVKVGVWKMVFDRWIASVCSITILANELFSSSVPKFIPAVRDS